MKATALVLTLGLGALPVMPAPAPAPEAPRPTGLYSPSQRGDGHWTWPGDLREHLRQTHGIDASRMSDAEAMAQHDADHLRRPYLGRQASHYQPARPVSHVGRPTYRSTHPGSRR